MDSQAMSSNLLQLKQAMRATWMAGDFGQIARYMEKEAEAFVERLGIIPGMKVLDVACGTGNVAVPAARKGAQVVVSICGEGSAAFHQQWNRYVEEPTQQAGVATPQLVVLPSRYRLILAPIVDYVLEAERCCPNQQIAVLIPELVQRRWYHHVLHNKRASVLKALLLLKGNQRIIVINVPWYLCS